MIVQPMHDEDRAEPAWDPPARCEWGDGRWECSSAATHVIEFVTENRDEELYCERHLPHAIYRYYTEKKRIVPKPSDAYTGLMEIKI